jgi:tight adherence protein C
LIRLVAVAWGVVAAAGVLAVDHRLAARQRARTMRPARRERRWRRWAALDRVPQLRSVVRVLAAPVRRRSEARRERALLAELPIGVDLVGVAIGAGCTAYQAVTIAARWSPPHMAAVLGEIDRQIALGATFDVALRDTGARAPTVRSLTEALRTTTRLGAPTLATLARVAREVRSAVRRRAESRARTVPVRLLFPLVFCILPAFALLTVVPVLLDGVHL